MEENIKITTDKKTPVPKKKQTTATKQQPKDGTLKAIMGQFVERMAEAVDNGEYTLKKRQTKDNDQKWIPCTLIVDGMEIECSLSKDNNLPMVWCPFMTIESTFNKAVDSKFKGKREKKLSMEADALD